MEHTVDNTVSHTVKHAVKHTAKLGQVIRTERRAHGMTQGELAALAGVGLNFISQLESGKEGGRIDKILHVLEVLGLELVISRGTNVISVSDTLFGESQDAS
ncbi:MAG: helix-turn-helix transcriptional regulator [bacterium]|nr:helix-turn-helix transcriptional regulator [bacterium]